MSELALIEQDARETQEAMLSTPVGIIDRALERLAGGRRWCRDAYALNGEEPVPSDSPDACRWCLLGALGEDAAGEEAVLAPMMFTRKAIYELYGGACGIDHFNDAPSTTPEMAVAVLIRARELAVAAESEVDA
jgi:hypothetical protein